MNAEQLRAKQAGALDRAQQLVGGPYALAVEALDRAEERSRSWNGTRGHSTSLGTHGQDLVLLEAARLLAGNPNGCRGRFARLLEAVQDDQGLRGIGRVALAREDWRTGELVRVLRPDHWAEREVEIAERIVRSGTREEER